MAYKDPERATAYQKRWAEENRDKRRAACKRWALSHPEQVKLRNKIGRTARGKVVHAEEMKKWRRSNPRAAKNADLKRSFGGHAGAI